MRTFRGKWRPRKVHYVSDKIALDPYCCYYYDNTTVKTTKPTAANSSIATATATATILLLQLMEKLMLASQRR